MPLPPKNPQIEWLVDVSTGDVVPTSRFLIGTEAEIFGTRLKLKKLEKQGDQWLVCAICRQPVYLTGWKDQTTFWFKHHEERGNCPIKTRGAKNQELLRRIIYNGARESDEHKRLKELIRQSLAFDSQCSEVHVEERFYSPTETSKWRQPDVRATIGGRQVAFEVQRSSTFIDVITERWHFYDKAKVFLVWVIPNLDEEYQQFTIKDIFYINNRNVFVINDETLQESRLRKKAVLQCYFHEPHLISGKIAPRWASKYVTVSSLTFDQPRNRVYAVDCDALFANSSIEQSRHDESNEQAKLNDLREEFENLWISDRADPMRATKLTQYQRTFRALGLTPEGQSLMRLGGVLDALYSVKRGQLVGFEFRNLLQLAHWVHTQYLPYSWHFWWLANAYGRSDGIKALDKNGKLKKKLIAARGEVAARNNKYAPDRTYDALLGFLFPSLSLHMKKQRSLDN